MKNDFKNKILGLTIIALLMSISNFGHAQNFLYRAVVRDGSGFIQPSKTVTIEITLWNQSQKVYTETHSATSDALGYIAIPLGKGTVEYGVIKNVNWDKEVYIEVDIDGVKSAKTELYTIPKSFYATKALYADSVSWAEVAESIDGIIFDDEGLGSEIYWSSEKINKKDNSLQDSLTALEIEIDDKLNYETTQRIGGDAKLYDSIVANKNHTHTISQITDFPDLPTYVNIEHKLGENPLNIFYESFVSIYLNDDVLPNRNRVATFPDYFPHTCNLTFSICTDINSPNIFFTAHSYEKGTNADGFENITLYGIGVYNVGIPTAITRITLNSYKQDMNTFNSLDVTTYSSDFFVVKNAPNIKYFSVKGFIY